MWTLRKTIPTKKGSWWLTGLKLKNKKKKKAQQKKSLAAISTQELLSNATHQGEACSEASASRAVFLYKGVPGVALQPIAFFS